MEKLGNISRVLLLASLIAVFGFNLFANDDFEGEVKFRTWTRSSLQSEKQESVAVFYITKKYIRQEVYMQESECWITQVDLSEATKATAIKDKYVMNKASFKDLDKSFDDVFPKLKNDDAVVVTDNGFWINLSDSGGIFEATFSEDAPKSKFLEFFDPVRAVGSRITNNHFVIPQEIVYRIGEIEYGYVLEEIVETSIGASVFELPPVPKESSLEDIFEIK